MFLRQPSIAADPSVATGIEHHQSFNSPGSDRVDGRPSGIVLTGVNNPYESRRVNLGDIARMVC